MKRKLPIAGIIATIAFILIENYPGQLELRATAASSLAERIIASKSSLVRTEKVPKQDVLIVGDSFASTGVDPRQLNNAFAPLKFYNLAMVATASFGGTYYLLDEYLAKVAPPKAAILLATNNALNTALDKILKTRRLARNFNSPSQILESFRTLGLIGALDSLLWRIAPSQVWNSHLRQIPSKGSYGWARMMKKLNLAAKRTKDVEMRLGFTGVNENKMGQPKPKGVRVKKVTGNYIAKIFELFSKSGVTPYCAMATIPDHDYITRFETSGSALQTTLDAFLDLQNRGCRVLDTPAALDRKFFGTLTHLNLKGAEQYTKVLHSLIPHRLVELNLNSDIPTLCETPTRRISSRELGAAYTYERIGKLNGSAIAWKLPAYLKGKKIKVEYLAPQGTSFSMSLNESFEPDSKITESEMFQVDSKCAWQQWTPDVALERARVITLSLGSEVDHSHLLYLQDTNKYGGQLYGLSALATIYSRDNENGEMKRRQSPLVSNLRISVID
jgi:hypothetical protein